MVDSQVIINQVLILFLMMMVGTFVRKKEMISNEVVKGLAELLLNVTSPALVIASFDFSFSQQLLYEIGQVLLYALCIHGALVGISKLVYMKYPKATRSVLQFMTIFSNCGYMGFPLLNSIYGKIGVLYGSVYVVAFNLFLWSVGVILFTGEKDGKTMKKAVVNPGIISVLIGIIIFVFSIKLPLPLSQTLESIGSMTTPLSMIIVGAKLAEMEFRSLFSNVTVYYSAFIRLIAIPIAVLCVFRAFGVKDLLLGVIVACTAMPAAAATTIFAEKYNGNATFASQCVLVTTLLSVITIPLVLTLV